MIAAAKLIGMTSTDAVKCPPYAAGTFVHTIDVRYGECDMQGVVFNANYLAYVDHAIDRWLLMRLGSGYQQRFDFMVKRTVLEWSAPARYGDSLDCRPALVRWGNTSFDVAVGISSAGTDLLEVLVTYVSVTPGTATPTPVPEDVREALS